MDEIAEVDIENPEHLARLVKENLHMFYQKQTAARVYAALCDGLGIPAPET